MRISLREMAPSAQASFVVQYPPWVLGGFLKNLFIPYNIVFVKPLPGRFSRPLALGYNLGNSGPLTSVLVDAALVEWAPKLDVSTPHRLRIFLIHLPIELGFTGR